MSLLSLRIPRRLALALAVVVLAAVFTGAALGQSGGAAAQQPAGPDVGSAFTYQGELENDGALVNSDCDFQFTLWTTGPTGGSTVGSPVEKTAVSVSDGRFSVELDFGNNFPTGQERWLEVEVKCPAGGGTYTSLGRQHLTAAPYAMTANNADTVDGYHAATIGASHDHAGQDWPTVNTTYGLRLDNSGSYGLYAAGGSIGAYGSASSYGLYGVSTDFVGVFGDGGSGSGDYGGYFTGYGGVYGNAENASGYGVHGNHAGAGYGVYGFSNGGNGVYGKGGSGSGDYGGEFTGYSGVIANAENAGGRGVYATSANPGLAQGTVTGINSATTGNPTALAGIATSGTDNSAYAIYGWSDFLGVFGVANPRDDNTFHAGVYGLSSGTGGYGVYSSGDMAVAGTLSKTAGSFKIDHPQDPANKYLYHSFVESPDMMNVYNGNVILDANGAAWVDLPGYFEALNMDFRYQLTSIGAPGPNLYVATEIQDNRFQIAGGEPGAKISWQVTGIRNDPYAQTHRIQVEVDKPGAERGTYLYPELYGEPLDRGFDYLFGGQVLDPETVTPDEQ